MIKLTWRQWVLLISLVLAVLMLSPNFKSGAVIKDVERQSELFEAGLRAGEIVKSVNEMPVKNKEDYTNAVSKIVFNANGTRFDLVTDKNSYTILTNSTPQISVDNIPRTHIKTGLDLSGGARALIKAENVSLSSEQVNDLVAITTNRLNAFGLSDLTVRAVKDLQGNNFMLIEIAGATPSDLKELVGKQGKFEAKVGNVSVFEGGEKDISDVCRNRAECAGITQCSQVQSGYACTFRFTVYLTEDAAQKHADITKNMSLDETGQYLTEKLYLYVDGEEVDSLLIGADLRGQVATQISIQGPGTGKTQEEAYNDAKANMNRLQTILITGSLPYKLEIVKLDTISPFLGKEFIKGMIILALVVFGIVSLILFIRYRKIKITLAVMLTMFSEAFITLGIAALIRWNLDAPSIAGIIAGIGVGVNDQIIIIEESESGGHASLKEKIKGALFIIIGAFFTIVAAMIPLFWAGAGMIRGFALTTIIGVCVGILITRPAFADIVKRIRE